MTSYVCESERILDAAIECTFPASDPIAVHTAFKTACEREDESARNESHLANIALCDQLLAN